MTWEKGWKISIKCPIVLSGLGYDNFCFSFHILRLLVAPPTRLSYRYASKTSLTLSLSLQHPLVGTNLPAIWNQCMLKVPRARVGQRRGRRMRNEPLTRCSRQVTRNRLCYLSRRCAAAMVAFRQEYWIKWKSGILNTRVYPSHAGRG